MGHPRRHSTIEIEPVIDIILEGLSRDNQIGRAMVHGESVKINSVRLQTFARKGVTCVCCKETATFFAIERTQDHGSYHLNLYGERGGKELLFTHDHIIARSLGGRDDLTNTVPMCHWCNNYKSTYERKLYLRLELQILEKIAGK